MTQLLNNPEFKAAVKKLGFIFIAGVAVILALCAFFLDQTNEDLVHQNEALAGRLMQSHPGFEQEIAGAMTKPASEEAAAQGREMLRKYGYGLSLPFYEQPALSQSFLPVFLTAAAWTLLIFASVLLLLRGEYKKIYRNIQQVTKSAEKVVEGETTLLMDKGEGDFSKLGHSFNRMAERVKAGTEREKLEKQFLKNAISDISHQIRTPLSSVMMFNELMLDNPAMDVAVRGDFLQKIHSQLVRIQWLVESLLKMAMLESGTILFAKTNCNALELLEKSVAAVSVLAREKGVEIGIDAREDAAIFCDERWTAEACINIIKNAVEHTPPGGAVCLSCAVTTLFTRILIKDNGEGISGKDLPHIFERFYRGGQAPDTKSVGVGLSLSKLIVEGQGGIISVRSEPQQGSEFELVFMHGLR